MDDINDLSDGINEIDDDVYEIDYEQFVEEDSNPSFSEEDRIDSESVENFAWFFNCRKVLCSIQFHPKFPNISHLAMGGCNDKCIIFSLQEGKEACTREIEASETVSVVRYSSDGNYLAYAVMDGHVTIMSTKNDINDYLKYNEFEGPGFIEYMRWHQEKNLLLVIGGDPNIWCWYENSIYVLFGSNMPLAGTFFFNFGVAVACQDGKVQIWSNLTTNNKCANVSIHEISGVSSQTIEYCNGVLVVGQSNGKIFLVNPTKKVVEKVYQFHYDSIESISYCPSGVKDKIIASSSFDGSIFLWNLDSGVKISHIEELGGEAGVTMTFWHPSAYILIVGYTDGSICVFNCFNGNVLVKRRPHTGPLMDMSIKMISQTELLIASVGHDGSARMWLLKT
ncbi:Uncharacterized WD repeat-containing protein C25H1.08c [Babesia microti strain RI]|uniref:Uncharacterized WD repeat-containing protein C25H1.08c n=1 Tax=Babesia microti (strain RI) TaxID=1133968 RepID=A0A1N6LWH1_BABMR|nr:Uncharacterized WD repeat-containing protein C25H1.08c [Babesia microti strain RI]SIO73222.1 Uncharacterized WD repeat-containing protein C25H1.08c [Babesia microti strain RI]|eukprot:XP_021337330.1 Uncharacterized WD repeat-containing protein C25H1.08c [Babesia microti strain RI]